MVSYDVVAQLVASENLQIQIIHHQDVRVTYFPYTPLLWSKTGVCKGIPVFLIFSPKHRLWVLVRNASVPKIYVLSNNKKNNKTFILKIFNIYNLKKNLYIAWACFHNGN